MVTQRVLGVRKRLAFKRVASAFAVVTLACASAEPPVAPAPGEAVEQSRTEGAGDPLVPRVRRLRKRGWVEVSAQVLASENETPAAARDRALGAARRAAIETVAGVRVRSSLVSFEGLRGTDASSLVQTLTASRADALVLDEKLLSSRMIPLSSGGYRVAVVLRARVLDRSKTSDPGFRIEVELDRTRFLAGEEVNLAVRSSRDSRIYVLGLTDSGAAMLLPNRWLKDTRAEAGQWLRFPDSDLKKRGVRLIAQVPEGKDSATEALVKFIDLILERPPLDGQITGRRDEDLDDPALALLIHGRRPWVLTNGLRLTKEPSCLRRFPIAERKCKRHTLWLGV